MISLFKYASQIFTTNVKLRDLPKNQRVAILRSVILINILVAAVVIFFSLRIQHMVRLQADNINSQIPASDTVQIKNYQSRYHKDIDAKMFLFSQRLIDVRDEVMPVEFGLSMVYEESWIPADEKIPLLDLQKGGFITNYEMAYRKVSNGKVEEMGYYEGNILTNYSSLLFPLDKQLIILAIGTLQANESETDRPYLHVNQFQDKSYLKHSNYQLEKLGVINVINQDNMPIGSSVKHFYAMLNTIYLIYDHKNIRSYLKVTLYIIFSILIAVFALLINPKRGNAISGRISVIGSSVFSLSANVFQVDTMILPGSGITLIDLLTAFAGMIILVCFLVTTRTVKLNDNFGHNASKLYDMIMFRCLIFYPLVFFTVTYLQAR